MVMTQVIPDIDFSYVRYDTEYGNLNVSIMIYVWNLRLYSSCFKIRVKAYDPATPARAGYADVRINVIRNEFGPQFPEDQYTVTLYDNERKNKIVIQLNATDLDGVSLSDGNWKYSTLQFYKLHLH